MLGVDPEKKMQVLYDPKSVTTLPDGTIKFDARRVEVRGYEAICRVEFNCIGNVFRVLNTMRFDKHYHSTGFLPDTDWLPLAPASIWHENRATFCK